MHGNVNITGNRPLSKSPIRRAKHPTTLIISRGYGHRPANDKLQEENRQLRKALDDLLLRFQLASNNPGSALFPTISEYMAILEKITLLERQLSTVAEENKPAINTQIVALRVDYLKALDAMTAKMQEYIEHRIAGRMPRIPLMTVEA